MSALIGAIGRCFPEPLSRCFLPTSSSTRSGEGSECRVTIGDASCKVEGPRTEIGKHSCTVEGPLLSCSGRALGPPQCPFGLCFRRYEALRPGDGPSCSLHPTGSGVLRDQDNQQRYVRPAFPHAFWASTSARHARQLGGRARRCAGTFAFGVARKEAHAAYPLVSDSRRAVVSAAPRPRWWFLSRSSYAAG